MLYCSWELVLSFRLLVFAIVYMVGGIIINKYARKVEKGDEFPNKNFWKELPGYIKVSITKLDLSDEKQRIWILSCKNKRRTRKA